MTAFGSSPASVQQALTILLTIAAIASVTVVVISVEYKSRAVFIAIAAATAAAVLVLDFTIIKGYYFYTVNGNAFVAAKWIMNLPLWAVESITAASMLYAAGGLTWLAFNKRHSLTATSFKESADGLPAGICFFEASGLPRLVNIEMNEICLNTIKMSLLNADMFWKALESGNFSDDCVSLRTGESPIVGYPDGRVMLFRKYRHVNSGEEVFEMVATDVTLLYGLKRDLERKNEELAEMNRRLRIYGDNIVSLTREKEVLAAKIRIHDDMGKLLLTTRKKLSGNLSAKERNTLIEQWKTALSTFNVSKEESGGDTISELIKAARSIGVKIVYDGKKITDKTFRRITVAAAVECMTNVVTHANGNELYVTVREDGKTLTASFTNNGNPPSGEIAEGGGLSSLRTLVEREGGIMTIRSKPAFSLELTMKKGDSK